MPFPLVIVLVCIVVSPWGPARVEGWEELDAEQVEVMAMAAAGGEKEGGAGGTSGMAGGSGTGGGLGAEKRVDRPDRDGRDLDEDGELRFPPRATLRDEPSWLARLASIPRNCSSVQGGRPGLHRLPLRLPPNRISLRDIFVTRENYQRLGLGGIKHYYSLPPDAPAIAKRYKWRKCAVVGNSGTLLDSQYGGIIDNHDIIFRMNQAPVKGYELYVGRKSTFRILNSLWSHRYSHGYAPWDPGYEHLPLEKDATLILSRVAVPIFNELYEFWRKRRPDITLLMLNSRVVAIIRQVLLDYRARLCKAGYGPFTGGNTPSSGWVGVYLATQLCAKVNVYGFGVGEVGGKDVTYHYYQGYAARKFGTDVHSFDTETHLIKALSEAGKIKLCAHNESEARLNRRGYTPAGMFCGRD